MTDAKQALVAADGNFDKALEEMRKKGLTKAEKKGDRETREGLIESYVHSNRIGVVVEVNCETDFVARLPEFKEFAHQIVMQIAAMSPSTKIIPWIGNTSASCISAVLVALPTHIGKTPLASGSSVPVCPIFLMFKIFLNL